MDENNEMALANSNEEKLRANKCHTPGLALHATVAGKCPSSPEDEQEKQGQTSIVHNFWPILQILDGASAVCQDPDTVLIRVESMIENTTNSNEFRSKDGTVVRIPDADFNIIPRSVTKIPLPALPVSERPPSV
ncbi:hypothetical protein TNCV_1390911 [Trichonephila clavipes]|nr:hypothetical protein TNCV_1390911 [Trichonephila clavipes]